MGKAEILQELINTNLSLLKASGHHIDFKENMFKEPNRPGFESVGYALLMIINPEECKQKIPWPLVNDKAQAREFRTNFTKFIKMINSVHPSAKIPEINASSLQFPSGLKFLEFMHKLSTFALELELKKLLSPEEQERLISNHKPKDAKDQEVKLKILRSAVNSELEVYNEIRSHESKAHEMIVKLNSCSEELTNKVKTVSDQLESAISSLDCDDETKARLMNIEDDSAFKDYNQRVEVKLKELEGMNHKIGDIHSLSVQCCQFIKSSSQPQCLDGHKFFPGLQRSSALNRFLCELAGEPVVNEEGDVNLLLFMKAICSAVSRLTRSPVPPALCSRARDLQVRSSSVASRSFTMMSTLEHLLLENKQKVHLLRTIFYNSLKDKKIPDIFLYLKERPSLTYISLHSVGKENVEFKPAGKRKSIGTIVQHRQKVVCSYKLKREPKKHVSSTPIFKTPGVRKSLYNILPSGSRNKHKEADKTLEETNFNVIPFSPAVSNKHESTTISETSPVVAEEVQTTSPTLRCSRKSLNDIIKRYHKLKETMNLSNNTVNESHTCNETVNDK